MPTIEILDTMPDGLAVVVPTPTGPTVFIRHAGKWFTPFDGDDREVPSTSILTVASRAGTRPAIVTTVRVATTAATFDEFTVGAVLRSGNYLHWWDGTHAIDMTDGSRFTAESYLAEFGPAHIIWEPTS